MTTSSSLDDQEVKQQLERGVGCRADATLVRRDGVETNRGRAPSRHASRSLSSGHGRESRSQQRRMLCPGTRITSTAGCLTFCYAAKTRRSDTTDPRGQKVGPGPGSMPLTSDIRAKWLRIRVGIARISEVRGRLPGRRPFFITTYSISTSSCWPTQIGCLSVAIS